MCFCSAIVLTLHVLQIEVYPLLIVTVQRVTLLVAVEFQLAVLFVGSEPLPVSSDCSCSTMDNLLWGGETAIPPSDHGSQVRTHILKARPRASSHVCLQLASDSRYISDYCAWAICYNHARRCLQHRCGLGCRIPVHGATFMHRRNQPGPFCRCDPGGPAIIQKTCEPVNKYWNSCWSLCRNLLPSMRD